jgi:hypothetical protein
MRILFIILLSLHGLIHFLGTAKAFRWGDIPQLTQPISKGAGLFWALAGLLLVISGFLYLLRKEAWALVAIAAIVLSQVLIALVWKNAWVGTLANVVVLLAALASLYASHFEYQYRHDVRDALRHTNFRTETLTDAHLAHVPPPVQKYLRYVGVLGKPEVVSFKTEMSGRMRSKNTDWFSFTSEQFSFHQQPARFFFMKAKIKGLPTAGYHKYARDTAAMHIKLLSAVTVQKISSPELFKAETVTYLNDLCLFAPATLVDARFNWLEWDDLSATVQMENRGITVTATLHFNEKGELVNFISNDRWDVTQDRGVRFSTPVTNYREYNGYRLPSYGEAIWHYPDGAFTYGEFNIEQVHYNLPSI